MGAYSPQDTGSTPEHDHPTKPRSQCNACTQRFGTVCTTTASISRMLSSMDKDMDYPEAAAMIQLVWVTNKQLTRIADALEKLGGAR